jgi:hypothetical protein
LDTGAKEGDTYDREEEEEPEFGLPTGGNAEATG